MRILFEDEHFIAVHKKSGLLVHPSDECRQDKVNFRITSYNVCYTKLLRIIFLITNTLLFKTHTVINLFYNLFCHPKRTTL